LNSRPIAAICGSISTAVMVSRAVPQSDVDVVAGPRAEDQDLLRPRPSWSRRYSAYGTPNFSAILRAVGWNSGCSDWKLIASWWKLEFTRR